MQDRFIADNNAGPASATGSPDCPRCNRPMHVKQMSPVLFASEFDDIVFGCVTCSAETRRTVRRR
jgi:hypothetical protein